MLSTPVWEAASISITSTWRPSMFAWLLEIDARSIDRRRLVVEGAGEDARGRGLAHAAHAGQHPGLGDAAAGKRVGQRAHHRLLADELTEIARTILARQHPVGRGP